MSAHLLANLKAYVALAGSIATAVLGVFAADSTVGQVATCVSVLATAFGTWAVSNKPKPAATANVYNVGH